MEGDRKNLAEDLKYVISIHALRVEGDPRPDHRRFQPQLISIHALRVEGDRKNLAEDLKYVISIHALRVEGDA